MVAIRVSFQRRNITPWRVTLGAMMAKFLTPDLLEATHLIGSSESSVIFNTNALIVETSSNALSRRVARNVTARVAQSLAPAY